MADAIYEHKKGKAWQIVGKLERENHTLRYQVRVLQARLRRVAGPKEDGGDG